MSKRRASEVDVEPGQLIRRREEEEEGPLKMVKLEGVQPLKERCCSIVLFVRCKQGSPKSPAFIVKRR